MLPSFFKPDSIPVMITRDSPAFIYLQNQWDTIVDIDFAARMCLPGGIGAAQGNLSELKSVKASV